MVSQERAPGAAAALSEEVRDGMVTIYSRLHRGQKGEGKGGLFLLAVELVTRSSGWEATAVICLS